MVSVMTSQVMELGDRLDEVAAHRRGQKGHDGGRHDVGSRASRRRPGPP
jgi:hypothetical protein